MPTGKPARSARLSHGLLRLDPQRSTGTSGGTRARQRAVLALESCHRRGRGPRILVARSAGAARSSRAAHCERLGFRLLARNQHRRRGDRPRRLRRRTRSCSSRSRRACVARSRSARAATTRRRSAGRASSQAAPTCARLTRVAAPSSGSRAARDARCQRRRREGAASTSDRAQLRAPRAHRGAWRGRVGELRSTARAAGRRATGRTCGAAARRPGGDRVAVLGRRVADVLGEAPAGWSSSARCM